MKFPIPHLLWCTATLLCCFSLTLYQLTAYPFAVHGDVGEILTLGAELKSLRELFLPSRWWGIPGLMLLPAWFGAQLDFSLFAARLPDAILGVLSSLALFALARRTLLPVQAFLFVVLITSSPQVLQTYRLGVGQVLPWLFTVLYCALAPKAWQASTRPALAGYLLGLIALLSFFVYLPARVLSVVFALQLLVALGQVAWRRSWRGIAILGSYAVVPACGFLLFLIFAHQFVPRSSYLYLPAGGWSLHSILTDYLPHIAKNSALALGSLMWIPGTANGDFYLSDYGFFDLTTIALGVIGFSSALFRPSSNKASTALLILIASAIILGGVQAVSPAYNRLTTLQCAFALLALEGWRICCKPRRSLLAALLATLLVFQIGWNVTRYFTYYGGQNDRWWSNRITQLAYYLREHAPDGCFAVVEPQRLGFYGNHGTLRLLAHRQGGIEPEHPEVCTRVSQCKEILMLSAVHEPVWQSFTEPLQQCGWAPIAKQSEIVQPGVLATTIGLMRYPDMTEFPSVDTRPFMPLASPG